MKKFVWSLLLLFTLALPMPTFAQETGTIEGGWVSRPLNQYGVLPVQTVQNAAMLATSTDPSIQQLVIDLESALLQRKTTFTIQYTGDTTDMKTKIEQAFRSVLLNNEYLSYDLKGYSYSGTWTGQSATLNFTASYFQTADQLASVDQKIKEIVPTITNSTMSVRDKIKAIHDYIITHVQYDTTMNQGVNASYFALTGGKTLCQGYAMLFYQMAKEVNIPVRLISGTAGDDKIGHAWNLVQVDGVWYHLDATWDDPIPDVAGRTVYNYYLVTNEIIKKDHYWQEGGLNGREKPYPVDEIIVTPTGTGSIAIAVLNDDKKAPVTGEPLRVKITDKNGIEMTSSTDTISVTDGTFTSDNTLGKGIYYVTISDGKVNQTTEVKVTTKQANVKFIWESTLEGIKDNKNAIKKSGAITGVVYDSTADTAAVTTDATVKIVSKKTTWSTKTNKNGCFTVYVPVGTYDVIIEGKDSANADDKKNSIYKKVKVAAGQAASPLQQLNAGLNWEPVDKDLDFVLTESSLAGKTSGKASKAFTGKALANSIVSVYRMASEDTIKIWVAEAMTKKNGEFSVSVPSLAGKRVLFRVQDEAGNIYDSAVKQIPTIN